MTTTTADTLELLDSKGLLDSNQTAELLGISRRTLEKWRSIGAPTPRAVKFGGRAVRYRPEDVRAFIEEHLEDGAA